MNPEKKESQKVSNFPEASTHREVGDLIKSVAEFPQKSTSMASHVSGHLECSDDCSLMRKHDQEPPQSTHKERY